MSPVRVKVKPSWPDLNLFQTVESGVLVRKSVMACFVDLVRTQVCVSSWRA